MEWHNWEMTIPEGEILRSSSKGHQSEYDQGSASDILLELE